MKDEVGVTIKHEFEVDVVYSPLIYKLSAKRKPTDTE